MYPIDSVNFVGGPFDGYSQAFQVPATGLIPEAAIPLSENMVRALTGEHGGPVGPCNRFAIYRLRFVDTRWQYRFQGVIEHVLQGGGPCGMPES